MIKVGNIVSNEVNRSGKSKTQIAKDVHLSRTGLAKVLARTEMDMKYILGIGKSIRYDFSKHFPALNSELMGKILSDPLEEYESLSNGELRIKLIDLQSKYINLLEEHVELLKQVNQSE